MINSIDNIIIGGGIAHRKGLIDDIRKKFRQNINRYINIDREIIYSTDNKQNAFLGAYYLYK